MARSERAKRTTRTCFITAASTSTPAIAGWRGSLAPAPAWLAHDLQQIDCGTRRIFEVSARARPDSQTAHRLSPLYRQTLDLRAKVAAGDLDAQAKASLLFELDAKIAAIPICA